MKLFIDTANLEDIEDAFKTGIISGVTTNPSLLAKEPKEDFLTHIARVAELCKGNGGVPLSVEVFAEEPDAMYSQSLDILDKLDYHGINIKIPVGYKELKVIKDLNAKGVLVNCTCCFSETQLQMAAAAGARYVSLFYNRLIDYGGDPLEVLRKTRKFIDSNELCCEIISGSIRLPTDVSHAWANGSDIVTAGMPVIRNMMKHKQTDKSVLGFLEDFKGWIS